MIIYQQQSFTVEPTAAINLTLHEFQLTYFYMVIEIRSFITR